ncbi:MAG TPA: lasso peptide biosynthesis B2 protein [Allosphingosinicella sp.]|jgi:hypothetical protein
MSAQSPIRRRRPRRDLALLAEALAAVAAASAAIRAMPFRTVGRLASRTPAAARPAAPGEIATLKRAVLAWARRAPWRVVCFQQALALQILLRRRGIASRLHYGIVQEDALKAHVWLSVDGETVIGAEEAPRFAEIACFPPRGEAT